MNGLIDYINDLKNDIYFIIEKEVDLLAYINSFYQKINYLIEKFSSLINEINNILNSKYRGFFLDQVDPLYIENIFFFYDILFNLINVVNNIEQLFKSNYPYKFNLISLQKQKLKELVNNIDLFVLSFSSFLLNFNEFLVKHQYLFENSESQEL